MLRTGEDWDSQQHGNARSVTEIYIHEIFRSPVESIRTTSELEAHLILAICVKLIKWTKDVTKRSCVMSIFV